MGEQKEIALLNHIVESSTLGRFISSWFFLGLNFNYLLFEFKMLQLLEEKQFIFFIIIIFIFNEADVTKYDLERTNRAAEVV